MADSLMAAVLPVYLVILLGSGVRLTGLVKSGTDAPLTVLAVQFLLPCLILDKICGNDALRHTPTLVWSAVLGFAGVVAGTMIAYICGRWLIRLGRGGGLRTFAMSTGLQNYGFMAIPVMAAIFPGDRALGVLFLHNLGVELAMWTVGLVLLQGSWSGVWRFLLNGPILAVVLGVLLVKTGYDRMIPVPLETALAMLGNCAVPISLLLVGMTIADLVGKERPSLRIMPAAVVLRLAVIPLFLLAAARWLPLVVELRQVLVVQAAMPAAVFSIVLARHYGGHPGTAVQVVLATNLAGLLTIPWVIAFGMRWVMGGG